VALRFSLAVAMRVRIRKSAHWESEWESTEKTVTPMAAEGIWIAREDNKMLKQHRLCVEVVMISGDWQLGNGLSGC
jgi:hypothetical protein